MSKSLRNSLSLYFFFQKYKNHFFYFLLILYLLCRIMHHPLTGRPSRNIVDDGDGKVIGHPSHEGPSHQIDYL